MKSEDITIAITVYNRRNYILQAIESALNQTQPVRVMVVEDCAPDSEIQQLVISRYGDQIIYHRNSKRHGLFDTWNVCLDLCETPWLSILHDDDYLAEDYIQTMQELSGQIPGQGLYFCSTLFVNKDGKPVEIIPEKTKMAFKLDLFEFATNNLVLFAGQLIQVQAAKAIGGFRKNSMFTGDWEMWYKLAFHYGAAKTGSLCAYCRTHEGIERGTNKVMREGRIHALDFVQIKRNLALFRTRFPNTLFNRKKVLTSSPVPVRFLLQNAACMSKRKLRYCISLLQLSRPINVRYAVFQKLAGVLGPGFVRFCSKLFSKLSH